MIKTDYSAIIQASGGCTPYKWAIVSGPLPAGVNAKVSSTTTTLKLTGTPTTAATHSFVVQVTGCGGAVSRASYKVVIQARANHVVDLNWKAPRSSNIVGYNAYRSPDGATWKRVNASLIASTLYSDSTVANNTTYYYATTAVDVYGHESRKSAVFKAVVP
jgi:fibronectin type 3 domain-containing protein